MESADDDIDFESRVGELLERGLERYGDGDLEGALSDWKHVLVLDPDNEKAAHYSTYVEDNHDLADSGTTARFDPNSELDYPFGLEELGLAKMREDELGDYESFELVEKAADAKKKSAKVDAASIDEGWNVDEGWVEELVRETDTVFKPDSLFKLEDEEPEKDAAKKDAAKKDAAKKEAAKKEAAKDETADKEAADKEAASVAKKKKSAEGKAAKPKSIEEAFANLDLEPGLKKKDSAAAAAPEEDAIELGAAGSGGALPGINEIELDDSLDLDLPDLPGEQSKAEDEDEDDYAELQIGEASDVYTPGDEDLTGQHLALPTDEDSDVRAPTQDPALSSVPVSVDEALLSLEDSTREIEIGDSLSKRSPSTAEPGFVFDAKEDHDFELPSTPGTSLPDSDNHDDVLAAISSEAPSGDPNERTAFIVAKLIEHAIAQHGKGKHTSASSSVGEALTQADDCAAAQKLVFAKESELVSVLIAGLCDPSQVPELVVPLTEIPPDEVDNRAAFLLTRVDGVLSLEEILVISGMSKLEALRHLSRMHQRSYLSVT